MTAAPLLMMLASLAGAAPDDVADLKAMQGTWKLTSGEFNGQPAPEMILEKMQFTFKDDVLILMGPIAADANAKEKPEFPKMKIVLDPKTSPKSIDFTLLNGPKKGDKGKGIYEIDGDRMKLCFTNEPSQARPKDFKAAQGSQLASFALEREKPKK